MDQFVQNCREMAENGESFKTLLGMVEVISHLECKFCNGKGHRAKDCSSKRNLDITFRSLGVGQQWGALKFRAITEGVRVDAAVRDNGMEIENCIMKKRNK